MTSCIAGLQYLPPIEYFVQWLYHGTLIIEKHENYQKRTWRNKTAILGPDRALLLSVPLRKGKNHEMQITNVEISYDENWPRHHLGSIQTAYGKTAFFGELDDAIAAVYSTRPNYLWELNMQFIQLIISFFPGEWIIEYTEFFQQRPDEDIVDLRIGVPCGQSSLLDPAVMTYDQIQRLTNSHLPNLCILDVLCHLGPGTYDYLKRYAAALYS